MSVSRDEVYAMLRSVATWLPDRSVQLQGKGNSMVVEGVAATGGQVLVADGLGACSWNDTGELVHDHARPAWSATATLTTSFVVPAGASMLHVQLLANHANASGIWDTHIYIGTTSGGAELFSVGGSLGWLGFGAGSGCMYPFTGSYVIPAVALRGQTLYFTSHAPAGNYYLQLVQGKVYAS